MNSSSTSHWKRLWRWVSSQSLSREELLNVLGNKDVKEELSLGLASYKPQNTNRFSQLQSKHPDQTKLLNVIQTLHHYVDIDSFQLWEIVKHYLCDISYGTPANALKNVAFVDTRPSFLLPNVWKFYYAERLYILKTLQYIIEFKNDTKHKYHEEFAKIINDIGLQKITQSLIDQLDQVISSTPPSRKIQNDFASESVRTEWAEHNLREQLAILQCILLIVNEVPLTAQTFNKLFELFRKHSFGKRLGYSDLLDEKHRESCLNIMYIEIGIFIVVMDSCRINDQSQWIDSTKAVVEGELTTLQVNEEHGAMLLAWMMMTLQSETHCRLFENHYQHFGATAMKMRVFEFLLKLLNSPVFSDNSKCADIARYRVFTLLNEICDTFDGDGTISHQPGAMSLCAELLRSPAIAKEFWSLHGREERYGTVSLWNTALEFFPFNFTALSVLSAGLAQAGKDSVRMLTAELKNLPVYTEIYQPNLVPIVSLVSDDATIGRDYFPLDSPEYRIEAGSKATIMERKEGTLIHFRTPYTYWTILNHEIEKSLDRKGHHKQNLSVTLQKVYEGAKVLKGVLKVLAAEKDIPKSLVTPCEGIFDVLLRFMKTDSTPLLVECLEVCTALIPVFPKEVHMRLVNTGLLPRVSASQSAASLGAGGSLHAGAVARGAGDPADTFLQAYRDMLVKAYENSSDDRIISDIVLPGLVFMVREVFPNISTQRYSTLAHRRDTLHSCIQLFNLVLQQNKGQSEKVTLLQNTCVYSLLHTENALELLKIISIGNDELERVMLDESNWVSGSGVQYIATIQRTVATIMLVLRLKPKVTDSNELTPLEHLIFSQNQHKDLMKVIPKVTSYINNAFSKNLSVLCCRLLKKFAESFQMSLFASLDMTSYQVRVMFLDRLRDEHETTDLKIAILEFVATCIGKQPGLTEAFFKLNHVKVKEEKDEKAVQVKKEQAESFEGILGYMADYLGTIKQDAKMLHSPLLGCIMALFHALWKNNMQVLVKDLRENPKFWEHMSSPLFSDIQPGLRTYAQIFNVLGIELFLSRDKIEPNLKEVLEQFFDTNKNNLDKWINYVFSFEGRSDEEEVVDKVPAWLGLLTSWKDFTTIFCKCLPISLNIAHKAKLVAPCMTALLQELDDLKDGRLVVILAELYVIMLANWKDDCFDNRKANAKQIDNLLTNTAIVYDCLHPRAKRAILSIGTVAISSLDYEIKANSLTAQSIIRSVTNINSLELEKLLDNINEDVKPTPNTNGNEVSEDIPPVVLALALLEQCLELYDDMFSGLSQWFQATRFTNKLLCCLQSCLQKRCHYQTSLAALRCLTAYSRGPFAKELLLSDVDQFLWMQLLPPKFENSRWKLQEWWRVYAYSLDFISMMVMKHGQFYASDAITFVGVHLEHLIEAILLPRQIVTMDSLNLCASSLNLIVQMVKFEARWRIENINSLVGVMRSISALVHQCVSIMLRSRRASESQLNDEAAMQHTSAVLHRTLEILHMATLCLLSFSPSLLSLLGEPALDLERWQPLVELDFAIPKHCHDEVPQLTFGTLLTAICLLTKAMNHSYHTEEGSGSRSPRRRRGCSCSSPDPRRAARSESLTSVSSATSAPCLDALSQRLVAGTLAALLELLASQALLAVRDVSTPSRHKQMVRRELSSELTVYHDFVRKRILCAAHARPYLARNKLGAWPLAPNEEEAKRIEEAARLRDPTNRDDLPPPPPPKRAAHDSMREYILRKHYLDKCAQTPTKEPPSPVSHSTPTSDKKKDASRSSKRVSWAETTRDSSDEDLDASLQEIEPAYSNQTDVQINNDEDYFHFMSVVFLYICQMEL
ncbi:hypothetical protein JYU34_003574 [Plutella xylostella]|uniref:Nucleoporin NUP188 n=1 Tax=Plutella xylostella TaxID=51655 RepID=A0ABQ7R0D5_PLUXY|nr:hypothetical protein JYU34_003574 [Plutella xylostella]